MHKINPMKNNQLGKLYLIPTTLGDTNPSHVLPAIIERTIAFIDDFVVENEKTARKSIKLTNPDKIQSALRIQLLNKRTTQEELSHILQPCFEGKPMGLLSEAGCPGVADPGAVVVKMAHENKIQVVPLVGPSSILLAMMASGMNGQNFAFNGYLPIDKDEKKVALKNLEKLSFEKNQSQIFIETPYRNNKMLEDLCSMLHPETQVCVAADITLQTEYINTMPVKLWKKTKVDLHNRPAIFIIQKYF